MIITAFLSALGSSVRAQSVTGQFWSDFTLQKNISSRYSFENELGLQTGLNLSNGWWSISTTPEVERSIGTRFGIAGSLGLAYTRQQASYETWEMQPGITVKYLPIDKEKILLRLQAKYEYRNLCNIETHQWEQDSRTRFKMESVFIVGGESLRTDRYTYGIVYAENFWTMDQMVEERYANRLRLSGGMGRRINKKWSVEASYTYQFSKNTIEGEIQDNQQQIFRLRIKYRAD